MKARGYGECRVCHLATIPGQQIALSDAYGWIHSRCQIDLAALQLSHRCEIWRPLLTVSDTRSHGGTKAAWAARYAKAKARADEVLATGHKKCRACFQFRATCEYGAEPRNPDGLTSYCRDCRAQRARDRRANAGEGFARQAVSLAGRNHDGPTKLPWSLRPWRFWRPTGRVTRRCGVTGSGSTTGPVWPVTCPGSEGRNDASRTTTRDRAGRSRQGSCRGETRPDAGRPGCRPSSWLARKKAQPCASATGRLCLPGRPGRYGQLRALAGTR
jgi:hypothetical protein